MRPVVVRRALGAVAALGVLAMIVFAIQLWRTSAAHRRAGLATLNDFAGVALDRYASTTESLFRMAGIPLLYPVDRPVRSSTGRLADLRDILEITRVRRDDPCHCLSVMWGDLYFAGDRDASARTLAVDSAGHPMPLPPWLASVLTVLDTLTGQKRR
ncbi:MAG TPA: hypothetical protein VFU23_04260, partial [Gemmatimonadales bacterium]|nr:hypothetical protein [Gemmatimonadales bacterium]